MCFKPNQIPTNTQWSSVYYSLLCVCFASIFGLLLSLLSLFVSLLSAKYVQTVRNAGYDCLLKSLSQLCIIFIARLPSTMPLRLQQRLRRRRRCCCSVQFVDISIHPNRHSSPQRVVLLLLLLALFLSPLALLFTAISCWLRCCCLRRLCLFYSFLICNCCNRRSVGAHTHSTEYLQH